MRTFQNDDLCEMLADEATNCRMLALEFLSEGYAANDAILPAVFAAWDRWGIATSFPEFPILSSLPVAATHVADCCQRAAHMARQKKLTDPVTRCAGKLLEQVVTLRASDLRPHVESIAEAVAVSKIFFRVNVEGLRHRVGLIDLEADALALRLDNAVEALTHDANNSLAAQDGLHALEAIRFQHPDYIDMSAAIAHAPPDESPGAISFQLSLRSLIQFEQAGSEGALARHLSDQREPIHMSAVEALVRAGTPLAAAHILSCFFAGAPTAQRWMARGLQRIRAAGLAREIANLRGEISDPSLWLMLLVAEVRQFDVESLPQITAELPGVNSYAGALIDALNVYVRMHNEVDGARELQQAFMTYVQAANQELQSRIAAQ